VIVENFDFIVYQPNPGSDRVTYWLDGDQQKKIIRMDGFIETIRNRGLDLIKGVFDSLRTYSFYMISVPDQEVIHLFGQSNGPYRDNITDLVNRKPSAIKVSQNKNKTETVEDILNQYGFSAPDPNALKNLNIKIQKRSTEDRGIMSQLLSRLKGN